MRLAIGLGAALVLLSGCRNDCQRVCAEMADLYSDCGLSYSDADLVACLDTYQAPDEETLAVCANTVGQLEEVLEYKSADGDACSELATYTPASSERESP